MGLDDLPVLADRPRCAVQKWAVPTRLDEKTEKDKADVGKLEAWKRKVYAFAKYRCLACGIAVIRTLKLVANRAEAHHIERRSNKATRYDERNGACLCLTCHGKVTRSELRIVGTRFFTLEDSRRRYIDATAPLRFDEVA